MNQSHIEPNNTAPEADQSEAQQHNDNKQTLMALEQAFHAHVSAQDKDWFASAQHAISEQPTQAVTQLLRHSAVVRRKVGREPLIICPISGTWSSDDIARLLLLKTCHSLSDPVDWPARLQAIYRQFDDTEQVVLVRSLRWLADDASLVGVALDAGRTHHIDVFSALAYQNLYVAQYYPVAAFNKLVLKALFLELDIRQMTHLSSRLNAALSRLCADYVEERQLAKRTVPESIWFAMRYADLPPAQQQLFITHLKQPAHRLACLSSLLANPPRIVSYDLFASVNPAGYLTLHHHAEQALVKRLQDKLQL